MLGGFTSGIGLGFNGSILESTVSIMNTSVINTPTLHKKYIEILCPDDFLSLEDLNLNDVNKPKRSKSETNDPSSKKLW